MKNNKLLIALCPGIIFGMLVQHQFESGSNTPAESSAPSEIILPIVSESDINEATMRYNGDATITNDQKISGAVFDKNEVMNILNNANDKVYVRLGLLNNKMTIYIGNDNHSYIKPAADGYCPTNCPW